MKSEIPHINNLATTSALTAIENKMPSLSNLVKKADYIKELMELKRKLLIIFMTNINLPQNLISLQKKYLT